MINIVSHSFHRNNILISYLTRFQFFHILQVKGGSIYDNILLCDDPAYAKQVVDEVFANREVSPCSYERVEFTGYFCLFLVLSISF